MSQYATDEIDRRVQQWFKENWHDNVRELGSERIIWVDIETTGLDPVADNLIEVAIMVTDENGFVVGVESVLVHDGYSAGQLKELSDPFVQNMHDKSNLWRDLMNAHPGLFVHDVADQLEDFLKGCGIEPGGKHPMAGSSVDFDRAFLKESMGHFVNKFFGHRVIDVSAIKEVARRVNPELLDRLPEVHEQMGAHRGIPDLIDTIEEYRFYLAEFLWTKENAENMSAVLGIQSRILNDEQSQAALMEEFSLVGTAKDVIDSILSKYTLVVKA